jgi:hypothetical protein
MPENASAALQYLLDPANRPANANDPSQGVTVTTWTVGYDDGGHLSASCLVTPDPGVDISFCGIALYVQGTEKIIIAGQGGINDWDQPGVGTEWGANAVTQLYPQGKGTTVTSVVMGIATYSSLRLFWFQQDFQI